MSTTTNQTHTPGPWKAMDGTYYEEERWGVYVDGPMQYHIATIENGAPGDTLDTEAANARLIASAPDLLAQLKKLLDMFDCDSDHQPDPLAAGEMIDATLALIAKAEGRQP